MTTQLTISITPAQLKCLNTLISKRGIDKDTKAVMVAGFSNNRCTSSKELYYDEAADMIKHLQTLQPHQPEAEKMRNKILYYAHEMNWRNAALKLDMQRVDAWCNKFGYLHKDLDQYEYKELPKLVSQFEIVYRSYLRTT